MDKNAQLKEARVKLSVHKEFLLQKKNVIGVGIAEKISGGKKTGIIGITCLVVNKQSKEDLPATELIPESLGEVLVDVIETDPIKIIPPRDVRIQDRTGRYRPVPAGVSVGHVNITAGTLGLWVQDADGVVMLSNNHVLANQNVAAIDDQIIQPGAYDGGSAPGDTVAYLKDYEPIKWSGDNIMDAAIAALEPSSGGGGGTGGDDSNCFIANWIAAVLNWFAGIFKSNTYLVAKKRVTDDQAVAAAISVDNRIEGLSAIPDHIEDAYVGMQVVKSGRTTEVKYGEITMIDAIVDVGYGNNQVARFVDQIITTNISQGGDSGSALLTQDARGLVGLLFAGSSTLTVHSPIQAIFDRFGLSFYLI